MKRRDPDPNKTNPKRPDKYVPKHDRPELPKREKPQRPSPAPRYGVRNPFALTTGRT